MSNVITYPAYKKTDIPWVGDIPEHWELVPCRSIVENIVEKNHDGEVQNYLSLMANVGVIRYEDKGDIGNKKPDDLTKCKIVRKGQLIINSMNYAIGSYGMSPYDGVCSPVYIILQAKKDFLLERYALRVFENSPFQKHLATFGNGILAHRAAIGWDDIKGEYIPVAPIHEQEKILQYLDHETAKIDALIEKQQQLIKLLKEKRQAVISQAVTKGLNPEAPMKDTDVEWLGEVPEHWALAKLSYRYEVLLGKMLDDKKITGKYLGSYLRNTDVQWDCINDVNLPKMDFRPSERERYSVNKGDLIVCEGGEIGRAAIWDRDVPCFYQKALHRLRPLDKSKDDTRFMFYILFDAVKQERFISGAGKATIAHLPAETFRQYRFAFPPLNEQLAISAYLDQKKVKFDLLEEKALAQISLLSERRKALISAAVTGKIDLREWQPANNKNKENAEVTV